VAEKENKLWFQVKCLKKAKVNVADGESNDEPD
jgi:hypothetical protein